jgi:hypothetical protein
MSERSGYGELPKRKIKTTRALLERKNHRNCTLYKRMLKLKKKTKKLKNKKKQKTQFLVQVHN